MSSDNQTPIGLNTYEAPPTDLTRGYVHATGQSRSAVYVDGVLFAAGNPEQMAITLRGLMFGSTVTQVIERAPDPAWLAERDGYPIDVDQVVWSADVAPTP